MPNPDYNIPPLHIPGSVKNMIGMGHTNVAPEKVEKVKQPEAEPCVTLPACERPTYAKRKDTT
jgi:hypothetical protein